VQLLETANLQTDVANALWITAGVLGAATVALLVVDLWTAKKQGLSLMVSPSRVTLSGSF
jgi:multisubunit Na+/H+ antiporter MnhC subunit